MDQEQKTREELVQHLEYLRRRLRDQEPSPSGEKSNGRPSPETRSLLQKFLERADEIITIQDAAGRYLYYNGSPKYGLATSDVVGKLPRDLFDPETADRIVTRVRRVADTGRTLKNEDSIVWQGKTLWFSQYLYPIAGDDGRVVAVGTITRDVTDGVRAEEALRESEERFRQLFENAPDAVLIADAETGGLIGANAAASRLLGTPPERIIGLHYTSLHPPRLEQYVRSQLERLAGHTDKPGFTLHIETLVLKPDGSEVPVEILAQTISLQGKKFLYGIFRDITRRVRIEQELRETERRYHNLLESVNLIAVILNPAGEITFCNQFLLDLAGWKIEEVLRKSWFDLFVPDEGVKNVFLRAVRTGEFPVHHENAIKTRTGGDRIVFWSNTVLRDLNGAIIGTASIGEDITERRKMEQALQESMQRFRDVVAAAGEYVWEIDAAGSVTYVSERVADILGYTEAEIVGKTPFDFSPPEERERLKQVVAEAIRMQRGFKNLEQLISHKDGSERWLRVTGIPVIEDGTLRGYRGTALDITDRRKAEEALRSSEERYKNLVELSTDIIYRSDAQGRETFMNDAGFKILEAAEDEVIGRPWVEWIHPDDRERSFRKFQEMIERGIDVFSFENRFVSKSGREIPLLHSVRVLRSEAGEIIGTQGIARDLSERKRMEEELLKAQKLESIGVLAGGIAHDFNNLLMAIQGNIALAKMRLRSSDKAYELLSGAESACGHARDLSYRLLTFSKGGGPFRQPVALPDILRDAAVLSLAGSGVVPDLGVAEDLFVVEADPGQLKQVIYNLLTNAKESMPGGGTVTINARNVILAGQDTLPLPPGPYVEIIVEDRGAGIPREHLERIFDPYFSTKEIGSQRGRGLGLAICHSIVQKHDGHISVESAVGKGTAFHVYLPAKEQGTRKEANTPPGGPGRLPPP